MNILIDGRTFVKSSAGISTFLQGSLEAWAKARPKDRFYLALPQERNNTAKDVVFPENVEWIVSTRWLFRKLPNLVWLCLIMPILCRKYKIDVYFTPVPCIPFFLKRSIKTVVVVHDVVNIEYKDTMEWSNRLASALFFENSIKKADVLWANSYYTKSCVEKYFPHRRCSDIFVGCSVNRDIYKKILISNDLEKDIRAKIGIQGRFVLFVGSLEPRKNLPFLLSLMPVLYKDIGLRLLVVGAKGWKDSGVKDIVCKDGFPQESVLFSGFVSNEELAFIYNLANVFVSPSLNEGFGMPQLEAMLCGCPVVTADNSAMTEVAIGKSNALLIAGYNEQTWISGIKDMLSRGHEFEERQFDDYDWNRIVSRLLLRFQL